MAKASGLGWTTLTVELSDGTTATDIKNDVSNLEFSTPRGVQDTTGINKSAMERLLLLADFSITLNGVFNATGAHLVFKTVPSTSTVRATALTVNAVSMTNETLYTDYAISRSDSGELTWSAPGVLADGTAPAWT